MEAVMHPYRVSIAFIGADWGALDVEVSDLAYLRVETELGGMTPVLPNVPSPRVWLEQVINAIDSSPVLE
jgi:hypothetical protein